MILSMKNMTWKRFGTRLVNYFLVIILIGAVISCSSRKVETEKKDSKEVTKIDSVSKTVEKSIIKIETKKDIEETEITYIPIDSKSDFIIDGKVYKNVQIKHRKIKDNTIIAEAKTIDKKQDIAVKKQSKDRINTAIKKVDKKGLDLFTKIGIIIIAISIIVGSGYLYIKK